MPFSSTEKAALQSQAQAIVDHIAAIDPTPDVNPLQGQLDAANATIANLTATVDLLRSKIGAAQAALA